MTTREIERIVVVGAGLMGHGIAQELAVAGYAVALHDASPAVLERVPLQIRENLEALVAMGRLDTAHVAATLARIRCPAQLDEVLADADLVIEAVSEDLGLKQELFARLDRSCPARTILASNTSSYLPSMLAERTGRPDKVLVTHYFNPPYLVPLVEIVRGGATSDETVAAVSEMLTKVGKSPAVIEKEVPGFVGNRLQAALLREALAIVEQGVARTPDNSGYASSTVQTCDLLRTMVELAGGTLPEAVEMASTTPARVLGLEQRKGRLRAGYDADVVVFGDQWRVACTLIAGEVVYAVDQLLPAGTATPSKVARAVASFSGS